MFSECKQNKLQTGQNSHLAVEPAAPAVLCRKKCADYFKYGVFFFFVCFFALAEIFFCIIQVLSPVQSTRRGLLCINGKFNSTSLPIKCHAFWE